MIYLVFLPCQRFFMTRNKILPCSPKRFKIFPKQMMFGLTVKELSLLAKLDSPAKIQDFLDGLKINFEENGETCMSPRRVLAAQKCHCMEGAMLAALALKLHGYKPLILHMKGTGNDWDHILAVFKEKGFWGAISKSNHPVLR